LSSVHEFPLGIKAVKHADARIFQDFIGSLFQLFRIFVASRLPIRIRLGLVNRQDKRSIFLHINQRNNRGFQAFFSFAGTTVPKFIESESFFAALFDKTGVHRKDFDAAL